MKKEPERIHQDTWNKIEQFNKANRASGDDSYDIIKEQFIKALKESTEEYLNNKKGINTMLNRKDVKKMLVWNNVVDKKQERYVLFINDDGSCIAVDYGTEGRFLKGSVFDTTHWSHCEPIPEKKFVPYDTVEEIGYEIFDWLFKPQDKYPDQLISKVTQIVKPSNTIIVGNESYKLSLAFNKLEVSKDKGKTWEPFGKEV